MLRRDLGLDRRSTPRPGEPLRAWCMAHLHWFTQGPRGGGVRAQCAHNCWGQGEKGDVSTCPTQSCAHAVIGRSVCTCHRSSLLLMWKAGFKWPSIQQRLARRLLNLYMCVGRTVPGGACSYPPVPPTHTQKVTTQGVRHSQCSPKSQIQVCPHHL